MIKFLFLQAIGIAGLGAAWMTGLLPLLIEADKVYSLPVIGAASILSLWYVARSDFKGAGWLADKLPVLGLVFTVAGVLGVVNGLSVDNLDAARIEVFMGTAHSLVANLVGMVAYAWVSLSIRVRGGGYA